MTSRTEIVGKRTAMQKIFYRYVQEYEGAISGMIAQTWDYVRDLLNMVSVGAIAPDEFHDEMARAADGIYRGDNIPTDNEIDIWKSMWKEVLSV